MQQSVPRFPLPSKAKLRGIFFGRHFTLRVGSVGRWLLRQSLRRKSDEPSVRGFQREYAHSAGHGWITSGNPDHYERLGRLYQQKRDLFPNEIKGSELQPIASRGSYFQLLSYRGISSESDVATAERLTASIKVASIPISHLYKDSTDHNILRFCFAKERGNACESRAHFAATITARAF